VMATMIAHMEMMKFLVQQIVACICLDVKIVHASALMIFAMVCEIARKVKMRDIVLLRHHLRPVFIILIHFTVP